MKMNCNMKNTITTEFEHDEDSLPKYQISFVRNASKTKHDLTTIFSLSELIEIPIFAISENAIPLMN
jgi:hypothetical protein